MGAYYSKIEDGKITEVFYKGVQRSNEETEKYNNNSKKYKEFLDKYGYYKIKLNQEKLLNFFEKNINLLETFQNMKNDKIIENFITSKKDVKKLPMVIMVGSMFGFYVINAPRLTADETPQGEVTLDDLEIILPKMYLIKDKYPEMIDFIINENMLKHDITDDKLKDMAQLKNLILHILEKIHEKMNPQVVFSNVLGLLIKLAIIISLFKAVDEKNRSIPTEIKQENGTVVKGYSKGLSSDEKNRLTLIIFKIITDEIINLVPDDKCNMLEPDMDFVILDPLLCKYDNVSIHKRNYDKCKVEVNKLKDSINRYKVEMQNCNSERNGYYEQLLARDKDLSLWKVIAFAFILLFVIFLVLYIMKKCTLPNDEED